MANQTTPNPGAEPRRNFVTKVVATVVGLVVAGIPAAAGLANLLDPLLKSRRSIRGDDGNGFLKVTSASALAPDGSPRLFKVVADLQDAWNKFPHTEIGSVFLRQTSEGKLECLAARCPHLGCTVDFKPEQDAFACPCHDSSFNLDGTRNNDIPPRSMDQLEAENRDGEIWVRYQKFRAGIHDKVPV